MLKFKFTLALVFIMFLFSHFLPIQAQNSDAPKLLSNTFLLQNCIVVKQPGTVLPPQHVLIKDGIIAEIGPAIKAPFDAQIIKADSFYVYAGFIDAYSNVGVTKPETSGSRPESRADRPRLQDPGNPPNDVAGITPQILVSDVFKSSDKSVTDMRAAGFGISHVAPRGLMLPGQSAIYLLGDGVNDKMMLKSPAAQSFQLEVNRAVYPSTTIAAIAKFRDLYKNAAIAGAHEEKFKTLTASGLSRPNYSKELTSLYPVTTKKMALHFISPRTKDVHKALSLRDELGFDLILTEVKQGWHYVDRIKKNNIPVLLSLELPEEEKADAKKEDDKSDKKDSTATKVVKKEVKKEPNPEKDLFDKKKQESIKEYLSQASLFEKNGIKFGFSFINAKPSDIKKNLRRLIENGLSENYALAALTTHPAQLLGVSHLAGTVDKGKIANLVVTDQPYFNEKSSIKYVFVDGKKYDYVEKPKKTDSKSPESGKIAGLWSYTVEVPGSVQKGKINIVKNQGEYKITVTDDSSPDRNDVANDVNIDGKNVTFNIMANMGQPVKIDFTLEFEDKAYKGSVSVGQFGSFPIKGELEGDPKLSINN